MEFLIEYKSLEDSYTKKITGTFLERRISYIEDDISIVLDLENSILERENDTFKIEIDFIKKEIKYYLKEYDKYLNVKINVLEYLNNIDSFYVKYYVEDNEDNIIEYKINYKK